MASKKIDELEKSVANLRGEQARQWNEMHHRSASEAYRVSVDSSGRHAGHEIRAQAVDQRMDALSQALAAECHARVEALRWMEEQLRELRYSPRGLSHARSSSTPVATPLAVVPTDAHSTGSILRTVSPAAIGERGPCSVPSLRESFIGNSMRPFELSAPM